MKCKKLHEQSNDKGINYGIILTCIEMAYYDLGDYDNALDHQEKSLEIRRKIKGENSINVADTLNDIGLVY